MFFSILFLPLLFTIGECLNCSKSVKLVKCLKKYHVLVSNNKLYRIRSSADYKQIQKETYNCLISKNQDSTPVECDKNAVACQRSIITLDDNNTFELSSCSNSSQKCDESVLQYLEDAMGALIKRSQCGTCTQDLCKATHLSEHALGFACYKTRKRDCSTKVLNPSGSSSFEELKRESNEMFQCLNSNYFRYRCKAGENKCMTTVLIYKDKRKLVLKRCANESDAHIPKHGLNMMIMGYVKEKATNINYEFCNTSFCNNNTLETMSQNGPFRCHYTDVYNCLSISYLVVLENEMFNCLVKMQDNITEKACDMGQQCWRVSFAYEHLGTFQLLECGVGPKDQCKRDIRALSLNALMSSSLTVDCDYCREDFCNNITKKSVAFSTEGNIQCYNSSWDSCDKYKFGDNSPTSLQIAQANMYKCLKSMRETLVTCKFCVTRTYTFKDDSRLVTRDCSNTTCDKVHRKNFFELYAGKILTKIKCYNCTSNYCNKMQKRRSKLSKIENNAISQLSSILVLFVTILFNALEVF